jgi:hypothetical protein
LENNKQKALQIRSNFASAFDGGKIYFPERKNIYHQNPREFANITFRGNCVLKDQTNINTLG